MGNRFDRELAAYIKRMDAKYEKLRCELLGIKPRVWYAENSGPHPHIRTAQYVQHAPPGSPVRTEIESIWARVTGTHGEGPPATTGYDAKRQVANGLGSLADDTEDSTAIVIQTIDNSALEVDQVVRVVWDGRDDVLGVDYYHVVSVGELPAVGFWAKTATDAFTDARYALVEQDLSASPYENGISLTAKVSGRSVTGTCMDEIGAAAADQHVLPVGTVVWVEPTDVDGETFYIFRAPAKYQVKYVYDTSCVQTDAETNEKCPYGTWKKGPVSMLALATEEPPECGSGSS